jgi:hypothetical protein
MRSHTPYLYDPMTPHYLYSVYQTQNSIQPSRRCEEQRMTKLVLFCHHHCIVHRIKTYAPFWESAGLSKRSQLLQHDSIIA